MSFAGLFDIAMAISASYDCGMKNLKIGFVGVGRMGANMARHLSDVGYKVCVVYDHHVPLAQSLAVELDCIAAHDLPDITAQADVIFTVVSDDASMAEIFAKDGALLDGAAGKLFINCATISPESHERAERAAADAGAKSLAASMASSITQAREGSLYLMVGGDEGVFQDYEPLLKDLSKSLMYVGPVGHAAKIKALVNMVMNINTAGLAEGLGLGAALGIDLEILKTVFSQTGANSRVLETDGEDMIARDHECYFSADHAAKDSGIANDLAANMGVNTPLSQATEDQYRKLVTSGKGDLDKSAISELTFPEEIPEKTGLKCRPTSSKQKKFVMRRESVLITP